MATFNPLLNIAALARRQKNLTKELGGLSVPYYKLNVAAPEGTPVKVDTSTVDTVIPLAGNDASSCIGLLLQNVIDDSTFDVFANMHYSNDTRTRPGNAAGILGGQGYASTLLFIGAVDVGDQAYFDATSGKLSADSTLGDANMLPITFEQAGNSDITQAVNGTYPSSYVHSVRIRFNFLPSYIANGSITADKIAAGAVTTPAIAAANVTTATLAPGAATLPKMSFTGIKVLSHAGVAAAGPVTLTGTAVGDRLVAVFGTLTAGGPLVAKIPGTDFQATVTVANQIQQSVAADLSASTYVFILAPAAA